MSYVNYNWEINEDLIRQKIRIKKPYYVRITSNLKNKLEKVKEFLKYKTINSVIYNRKNGLGTAYYVLLVQRKIDILKLIQLNLIQIECFSKFDRKLFKE